MNESFHDYELSGKNSGEVALEVEEKVEEAEKLAERMKLQSFFVEEHFLLQPENHNITRDEFEKNNKLQLMAIHLWDNDGLRAKFSEMFDGPQYKGPESIKLVDGNLVWNDVL